MAMRALRAQTGMVVERETARSRQFLAIRLPESGQTEAKGLFATQQRGEVATGAIVHVPDWRAMAGPLVAERAAYCVFAAVAGLRLAREGQALAEAMTGRRHLDALLGTQTASEDGGEQVLLRGPEGSGELGWEQQVMEMFETDGTARSSFWRRHMEVETDQIFRIARRLASMAKAVPVAAAMTRDVEGLDMERAESALRSVKRPGPVAVRWYGATDDGATDRRQAAEAYPLLAEMIATSPPLRRAVEEREPLQAAISKETGLAPAACRRIARVDAALQTGPALGAMIDDEDALGVRRQRTHGVHGRISLDDATGLLAQLDPSWVPDSNAAWDAFVCAAGSAVLPAASRLGRKPAELVKSSRGDWPAWLNTLAKAADYDDGEPVDRRRLALGVTASFRVRSMRRSTRWSAGQRIRSRHCSHSAGPGSPGYRRSDVLQRTTSLPRMRQIRRCSGKGDSGLPCCEYRSLTVMSRLPH